MTESDDPMDVLRLPVVPITPRPEFAAGLRARVQGWLGGDDDPIRAVVPPTAQIEPSLSVRGGADAIRWYERVFGARLLGDPIVEDNGRVGHAELQIGGTRLSLADEYPEYGIVSPLAHGGTGVRLTLTVIDCDATFAAAVAAGAEVLREPSDEFYGARVGQVRDPWGHEWSLHQPTEDLSASQLAERMAGTEYAFGSLDDLPTVDLGDRGQNDDDEPS